MGLFILKISKYVINNVLFLLRREKGERSGYKGYYVYQGQNRAKKQTKKKRDQTH